MGPINLSRVQEIRSQALAECLKDNFKIFELCHRKTNDEIQPSPLNYASPFIPAILLAWISWVFKIKHQVNMDASSAKLRKITAGILYLIGILGFAIPFFIVIEKEAERLHAVSLYGLFLMPWLAITWLSIPLFFQKLLDPEARMTEFSNFRKVIYVVAASPFLAIILVFARQG